VAKWTVGDKAFIEVGEKPNRTMVLGTVTKVLPLTDSDLFALRGQYPRITTEEVMVEAVCKDGRPYRFAGCDRNVIRLVCAKNEAAQESQV
jgi:hypothetical protein